MNIDAWFCTIGKKMMKLAQKVALITGGNSGIGLATAKLFSQEGAMVVIAGRDPHTLEQAAAEIGSNGFAVQTDVTDLNQLDQLYQQIAERFGKLDILFANAGMGRFAALAETSEATYDQVFAVNLKGVYFTVQKALAHFNDHGAIVLNTSFLGMLGRPNTSLVSASKAAVRSLTRTFAAELIPRGIRVNAVSPGAIATPFHSRTGLPDDVVAANAQTFMAQIPMRRFGTDVEIAKAVLFLSSSDSAYMVGTEVAVDGGISQL
jgi:NAD(P)-dependent dehydrogenase (short-subunit alcohol dehydrogenase family)